MLEIKPGCHVYGRGGRYVGRVEAANQETLRVHGTGPIDEVFYVPTRSVVGALAGGREIFLDCYTTDLESNGWLKPPHGTEPELGTA